MKVYIWGTGKMAADYINRKEISTEDILGFIESRKTKNMFMGKKVYEPQEISGLGEYDYILVCVKNAGWEIYQLCQEVGVDTGRLILMDNWEWMDGSRIDRDIPVCCRKIIDYEYNIQEIFPQFYNAYLKESEIQAKRYMVISRNGYDLCEKDAPMLNEEYQTVAYQTDYFRYRTFELLANEIVKNKIDGNTAEVGVFRGAFARLINAKFPNKKLYLFDTFESFDVDEFYEELETGRAPEYFLEEFKNTSVGQVLDSMPYPAQCIIRKGLFPKTAIGLEKEEYAFVSIDVDFEKSILEGLRYFYPRLASGGAIFVHDYNNRFLGGVKKAVNTYEKEIGRVVCKLPLADEGGTLVVLR